MATKSHAAAAAATRARRGALLLLLTVALGASGCKTPISDPFLTRKQAAPAADETAEAEVHAGDADQPSGDGVEFETAVLENDGWCEMVPPPFAPRKEGDLRWYHHQLSPLLRRSATNRPDLSAALESSNPVVVANAAILMAHWGVGQPIVPLVAAIRSKQLKMSQRCAAVEALGTIREPSPAEALHELLPRFAGSPSATASDEEPKFSDLQADLIRALARHAQPGDEKWFTAALRSPVWNVRFEGITAWAGVPAVDLPAVAVDLRSDQDPRLRAAALRAIAAHRDPHAIEYLQQALSDRVNEVHLTAVTALGQLGSSEALAILNKLKGERAELTRAASITALALAGLRSEVESAAKDTSQHVRLAVAETLAQASQEGKQVAAQTVATAQDLARDASAEVQRQSVESLATWPIEQAGPVLLLAIAEGGYTARKTAAKQLAERWPPAVDFPVDGVADRRAAAVAELKSQWISQYGEIKDAVAAAKTEARQLVAMSEDRVRQVQGLIDALAKAELPVQARREAVATLSAAGPELLAMLEQRGESGALPVEIYEEVLPAVSPTFSLLQRLAGQDLQQRRAAATELAASAAGTPLSPLALARLAALVERETDPVVWRSALVAVASDPRDEAIRMAYTAIGNTSVEVRCRACESLAAHGDARHAAVLLPALEDPDSTVALAAVRALGAVGTLDDPQPLVRLLAAGDKQMRLEAAVSLSRLHFEQGVAALERMALDNDLDFRLRAAKAMGEAADNSFVPALMAMLSDRPDAQRVAMISLAQIAGTDVAADVGGMTLSNDEKVRRWQFWYRDHPPTAMQ